MIAYGGIETGGSSSHDFVVRLGLAANAMVALVLVASITIIFHDALVD